MIRCLSAAIQRQLNTRVSLISGGYGSGSQAKVSQNGTFFYRGAAGFAKDAQAKVRLAGQSTYTINSGKEQAQQVRFQNLPSETKEQINEAMQKENKDGKIIIIQNYLNKGGNDKMKWLTLQRIIKFIFTAIFGWLFKSEQDTGRIYKLYADTKQNQLKLYKVKKGELLKKNMDNNPNHRIKTDRQFDAFQCTSTDQEKSIQEIVENKDNKVIQYLEAFVGNGLATNLLRCYNRKIKEEKQKYGQSKTHVYFYDMKQPPGHTHNDDIQWGEASDLHHLLTNLMEMDIAEKQRHKQQAADNDQLTAKQRQNSIKIKQILIINEVNLLSNSFQTLKKDRLEQLFKQIIYVNKENIAKVILISGNHYFHDNYLKKIESTDVQDYNRVIFQQLSEKDIRNIIHSRMAYKRIQELNLIKPGDKQKIDKIIDYIVKNNDCVKQCMRILKATKLDAKSQYENYLSGSQHKPQVLEEFLKTKFAPSLNNFEEKQKAAAKKCAQVISTSQDHIMKALGISAYKNLDVRTILRLKLVQRHKIQLLNDILDQRYKCVKQKSSFYLNYNNAKLQAFRELNNDKILHGFEFASKSTALAFKQAVKTNRKILSTNWFFRFLRWYDNV